MAPPGKASSARCTPLGRGTQPPISRGRSDHGRLATVCYMSPQRVVFLVRFEISLFSEEMQRLTKRFRHFGWQLQRER